MLLVKLPSRGFGHKNALRFDCPCCSRSGPLVGRTHRLPQLRPRTLEEAVHPIALAAAIVILANWLPCRLRRQRRLDTALAHLHILTFPPSSEYAAQMEFDAQALSRIPAFTSW